MTERIKVGKQATMDARMREVCFRNRERERESERARETEKLWY